jgi:hypothetical protein
MQYYPLIRERNPAARTQSAEPSFEYSSNLLRDNIYFLTNEQR